MAKYKIVATKIEYFEIEVDAESKEEAMEFAEENKNLFKFYREDDIEILKKLFPESEFKMLDNGQYQRSLEDGTFVTESVFGTPKLK
jgi:hypothetical protein